jgi:CheY-like chemotaxis protein
MHQDAGHAGVLGGARVLIVEDNFLIAADLDLVIEDAGGRTAALAGSIEQALQVLATDPVDGALLEFKLGERDAGAVVEALRRRGIPFVFYTGLRVGPDFRRRFPEAGVVEKPAPAHLLVEALAAALRQRRSLAA